MECSVVNRCKETEQEQVDNSLMTTQANTTDI